MVKNKFCIIFVLLQVWRIWRPSEVTLKFLGLILFDMDDQKLYIGTKDSIIGPFL